MELKTEGLVLKRHKSGEKDDITYVFTRELGKVMVISRSTARHGSKLRHALELFSHNTYFLVKPKKDSKYFTLAQATNISMFGTIRQSLRKIGFSCLIMELLHRFTELEDPHEELFDLAAGVMSDVESGACASVPNVEAYFKLNLLHKAGFDLTRDTAYLDDRGIAPAYRELLERIISCADPRALDVEYGTISDINMLIDGYIINLLGEDIFSNRIFEGLKNDGKD